ncbi:MAG: endonuclease [Elusimicrobia bacterium CG_4_10_14_0_2_um_filter_56_8]|nr:MAG: endonuclease [Elusimicrobia bacterium CG_4_10_14_0_2_um_filter_56_8]
MRRPQLHEEALQPGRPAPGNKAAASPRLKQIYTRLLKAFGPQGWWPVTPPGKTSPVYFPGFYGRPSERTAFEICAGAILTQNTAWANAERALQALNSSGLLSPAKIAGSPLPRLEHAVRSSGYFRQKARSLKAFCRRSLREHPEGFRKWFSSAAAGSLRAELLSYKGVGPETADCILLYAAGKPGFVVDAYTRRAGERLGLGRGLSYDAWKYLFEKGLPSDVKLYNEYHALLVKLGKDFCKRTKPQCTGCPLNITCAKLI